MSCSRIPCCETNLFLELLNIHNAFHQGQYSTVLEIDTSSFSANNLLPARILTLRARIALGLAEDVIAELEGEDDVPDLIAVKALAEYATGNKSEAIQVAETLAGTSPDNATVQVVGGTILQAEGKSEEALALLGKHQGSLEAYVNCLGRVMRLMESKDL